MNALEKQLAPIEKLLDAAWRDPDEALAWHGYGFKAKDVQRFVEIGVLDAHTAKALEVLGVRVGMLETAREPLAKTSNACPECGAAELEVDSDAGTISCLGCEATFQAPE